MVLLLLEGGSLGPRAALEDGRILEVIEDKLQGRRRVPFRKYIISLFSNQLTTKLPFTNISTNLCWSSSRKCNAEYTTSWSYDVVYSALHCPDKDQHRLVETLIKGSFCCQPVGEEWNNVYAELWTVNQELFNQESHFRVKNTNHHFGPFYRVHAAQISKQNLLLCRSKANSLNAAKAEMFLKVSVTQLSPQKSSVLHE